MPKTGTAVASFTGQDGFQYTVIIPATFHRGQLFVDATNYNAAVCAIQAAGLTDAEFEFMESEDCE